MAERDERGRIVKGSGALNPGGRPKDVGFVRDLARQHTEEAIATLVSIMRDTSARETARVAAAENLLDRGWGKAPQTYTLNHNVERISDAELLAIIAEGDGGKRTAASQSSSVVTH